MNSSDSFVDGWNLGGKFVGEICGGTTHSWVALATVSVLLMQFGCHRGNESTNPYPNSDRQVAAALAGPGSYAFDLDGDGVNDTNLDVRPCDTVPQQYCLNVDSSILTPRQIPLGPNAYPLGSPPGDIDPQFRPVIEGTLIQAIGDYNGDNLSEVSLLYTTRNTHSQPTPGDHLTPALGVFDVVAQRLLDGTTPSTAPPSLGQFRSYNLAAWIDYPRDPFDRLHPFLANGYGDELIGTTPAWVYLCLFRPQGGAQGRCGAGFVEVSTRPVYTDPEWLDNSPTGTGFGADYYFREVGGYLQDVDNDGWPDIHLIYHGSIVSISTQIAQPIVTTTFNVSGTGTGYRRHSGRLYGTHSSVTSLDGKLRNIILGGDPVEVLNDPLCNVSRFVTVLESDPGAAPQRRMAWTKYFGFFWDYGAVPGQGVDHCVTRFSDGRSQMDGEEVVIVNYFNQSAGGNRCPPECLNGAGINCAACLTSRGDWSTRVFRESDGFIRFDNGQAYIWGMSDRIHPSGDMIYLVEATASDVSFDLRDNPRNLRLRRLTGGAWDTSLGDSPVPKRPRIVGGPIGGPRGEGSWSHYAGLVLRDVDGDGLQDFLLEDNGTWIGWSMPLGVWEVKANTLVIELAGPGGSLSSVSSVPAGLNCSGSSCNGYFPPGTEVSLQPQPAPGFRFVNFTGDSDCNNQPMVINRPLLHCVANFAASTSVFVQQIPLSDSTFGNGADGPATVSSPVNINTQSLVSRTFADGIAYRVSSDPTGQTTFTTAPNPDGIAAGDMVLLINLQGSPGSDGYAVGNYDVLNVVSVSGNQISVSTAPRHNYTGGGFANQKVVVQRIPQYSTLTVLNGGTITAGVWDGLASQPLKTGIVVFAVQGDLTIDQGGMISVNALGYRGGPSELGLNLDGWQGEGLSGIGSRSILENGGGGGGGTRSFSGGWYGAEGGGGGHVTPGDSGGRDSRDTALLSTPGRGGARFGPPDLSDQIFFGGGGGAGGNYSNGFERLTAPGGHGGGIALILARNFNNQGTIRAEGEDGSWVSEAVSGGAGAGGSILIKAFDAALGSNLIHSYAARTDYRVSPVRYSSVGNLAVHYANSISGSAD